MSRHGYPFLILSLFLVLAASGCTTVETGNGVVIEEFNPSLTEIFPGEPVTFYLKMRNIGSVDAEGVFAELLGLDEDWAASSSGPKAGTEVLPQEQRCQYTGDGHTLKAPDLVYGTQGQTSTCTWNYQAPKSIPEGFNPTYPVTVRAFYKYKTEVVKSFTILPTSELVKLNQQGRSVPSSIVSQTRSPVTITAQARDPVRFWDGGASFPLAITISNSGGGMACLTGHCKKSTSGGADEGGMQWNKVTLKIVFPNEGIDLSSECSQYRSGEVVEVWPNRDNTIICDVDVSGVASVQTPEERTIGIIAEYSYFTDSETEITVL